MESGTIPLFITIFFPLAIAIVFLPILVQNFFTSRSALNAIPGPFLARFTNFWRLWMVYKGQAEKDVVKLHKRYGKAVRLGPNCVSLGDMDAIKTVYMSKGVTKSDMYKGASFVQDRKTVDTLFSTQNEAEHSFMFRPIARLYTMSNIVKHENLVDSALESFFHHLDRRFASTGSVCKLDQWISYFAWDIIGELTFSEKFGFMEQGEDAMGLIKTNEQIINYFAMVTQMPIFDRVLDKNPIVRIGPPSATAAAAFTAQRMFKRMAEHAQKEDFEGKDMMDSFIAIKNGNPEIPDVLVISWILMNVLAGSDTTSCALRAAIYYILKNERVHSKLTEELDRAKIQLPVSWNTVQKLPYLGAVVREALRIHPAVGINLERILPQPLTLQDGRVLPAGTIIGINPWVTAQDEAYGERPEQFEPERWLQGHEETDHEFKTRLGAMNTADLAFGFGKRACYGKPIALLEIHKTIAALFATYNMTLANPEKDWSTTTSFFVTQRDLDVRLQRRG